MNPWNLLAGLAVLCTSLQMIPQVIKSLRTKSVRDISYGLGALVALGSFCWMLYGIHLHNPAIVTANSINFVAAIILLVLKFTVRPLPLANETSP